MPRIERRQIVGNGVTTTSCTATWTTPTNEGSLLIALVGIRSGSLPTITLPADWTNAPIVRRTNYATNNSTIVYYIENAPSQTGGQLWTASAAVGLCVIMAEYEHAGRNNTNHPNANNGVVGTSTTPTTNTVAVMYNNNLIVGAININSNTTYTTPLNSFVIANQQKAGTQSALCFLEKYTTLPGSESSGATATNGAWGSVIASFRGEMARMDCTGVSRAW